MFTEATAAFLRELLNQPPPKGRYRELWIAKVENARGKEISQAAVARVIAEYLSVKGRPTPDPRSLRNLVSRALTGAKLTKDTLTLFIEAFGIAARMRKNCGCCLREESALILWIWPVGRRLTGQPILVLDAQIVHLPFRRLLMVWSP